MTVLVTGGAGYIGAHVVQLLLDRGHDVVIVDDLITGIRERVDGVPLITMDLSGSTAVDQLVDVINQYSVDTVIHFAARKRVDESVSRPAWYFAQNIGSLANVLQAMERTGIRSIVFSSSAAVYGATEGMSIRETDPTEPVNPYGESKLVGEWLIADAARAIGINAVNLRYFNVAGAGSPSLGDRAVLNLIPMVFQRMDAGLPPLIFGNDYPTADGTCVRDFIHVLDLAEAHLVALDYLARKPSVATFNVGTGTGTSVAEIIREIGTVSGTPLEPEVLPRRAGDPATVVASPELFEIETGWTASHSVRDMIDSAWESHQVVTGQRPTP